MNISQNTSLAECLRRFSLVEKMDSGDKYFCDSCGCLQEAERRYARHDDVGDGIRMVIKEPPMILCLHLKRFKYVENRQMFTKKGDRVVFSRTLRISSIVCDDE